MDVERKMVCRAADNIVGGVSMAVMTANGVNHPQERTMFNWALGPGERFERGAIYGIAIWKIADAR